MRSVLLLILAIWFGIQSANGQQFFTLSGKVVDEENRPLPGASVTAEPDINGVITDGEGEFQMENIPSGILHLNIAFLGYERHNETVFLSGNTRLMVQLVPSYQKLQEVVITDEYLSKRISEVPLNIEIVNSEYLRQNMGGSLMKSLERLPGVGAIDIGQGLSKPAIRGLSFNRVVVTENGIKHEGQQWGADHGLEIDQFANDRIEVIKGPSSLMYGSDAIGGLIDLKQHAIPEKQSIGGTIDLTGKSNNELFGSSVLLFTRGNELYFSLRATWMDYGDYRIPADSVDIYSFRIPLHERSMRNTAGYEKNLHLTAGWIRNGFSSRLFISRIEGQNGFFANAHGLEPRNVDFELHDRSDRDILDPYHQVKHWKFVSRTAWKKESLTLQADLGLQQNIRQEWSDYVSHGYMPPLFPDSLPFNAGLEREFVKVVYSGKFRSSWQFSDATSVIAGISYEYHQNEIDGRGFIIPAFNKSTFGSFLYLKHHLSDKSLLHAGIRYDNGIIQTKSYNDWFPSPQVTNGDTIQRHLQRSADLKRSFSNVTWSFGYNYNSGHLSLKGNLGKSFRMPIAKELAANGVNYHRFSYEVGNPGLTPEIAYQLDGGLEWHSRRAAVGITPFASYFPNYIYLNPGYEHDRLYGNGNQVSYYTQSRVVRYGGEVHAHYSPMQSLQLGIIGEHIYSVQLSGEKVGFTLPFSPPATLLLNVKYTRDKTGIFSDTYLSADFKTGFAQNRIVPPEEKTDGYRVVHLGMGGTLKIGSHSISISVQIRNLLNSNYFNHTSYYRLINVPEPGRNYILHLSLPFSGKAERKGKA